ncbi:MAG: OmpA family protein [Candidatus Cloacimonetes bacterium]|nr:OmpA family protein [Candidatus Cloacimonadota bacterium]MDD3235640.1 OmpA family protein [Candidatus Cloacimonadota bacterium]
MNKIIRIIMLVVLLQLSVSMVFAMEHTIGFRGGMAFPFADKDDDTTLHLMGGISYDAWLQDNLSLGLRPYFTSVEGAEAGSTYKSQLIGGDVVIKYRPTSNKMSFNFQDSFLKRISPYGELGFGVVNYKDAADKNKIVISAPTIGLGVSFQSKWKVNLDLGAQYNYAHDDNIDGMKANKLMDSYLMPYLGLGYTFGKSNSDTNKAEGSITNLVRPLLRNQISMQNDFTLQGVQFEIGSANLTNEAKQTLNDVATAMIAAPAAKVEVQGHTDNTGSNDLNNRLSLQRAESVKAYLVSKGVDANRLGTKGFGSSKPIASNNTLEGRTENRRIEFVIVK